MCILCMYSSFVYSQSDCEFSQSFTELSINNIRATIPQNAYLWINADSDASYLAPDDGSGVSAIYSGQLWVTGTDPDGTIKIETGGSTYYPGPRNPDTGETYPNACEEWDKHFTIFHSEKEAHQNDFADNNVVENPLPSIFGWPGRNNPHFNQYNGFDLPADIDLAPFVDINGDNIYDPAIGDYPDTKGDQAIWWVCNDDAVRTIDDEPIGIEIQAMAYAFQSFEPAVNNTTFYDFKLTYRGTETLTDYNFALGTDVDLGCSLDDYVGFNEERQMAFYYNVDDEDGEIGTDCDDVPNYGEEIPMLGIKLMSDSDDLGVTSFTYYDRIGPLVTGFSNDYIPSEYLYYMTARWQDGTPLTIGGDGYGGDTPTNIVFPGDPVNADDWSMCSATLPNGEEADLRSVMSTGGGVLNPGDVKDYSYAVIFVPDVPHPCPSLDMINAAADVIENFDCLVSSVSESNFAEEIGLQLTPNPTSQKFTIAIDAENILLENVEIIDLSGNVLQLNNKVNTSNLAFNIEDFTAGMYFVKVTTDEGKVAVRKLVVQ